MGKQENTFLWRKGRNAEELRCGYEEFLLEDRKNICSSFLADFIWCVFR